MASSVLRIFFLILVLLFSSPAFSQKNETAVARAGGLKITVNDFLLRYELSPFLTHKSDGIRSEQKQDFLYSLVAEKLWYLEAVQLGMAESNKYKFYFQPIEDIYLRDALFKSQILDKVKLSAKDVSDAISISGITLKTLVISSKDSAKVFRLRTELTSTTPDKQDSIIGLFLSDDISINPYIIEPGTLRDSEAENYLFQLNPGGVTIPIRSEYGWTLFVVKDKTLKPIDITDKTVTDKIKETVKNRKVFERTEEYLQKLLTPYRININEEAFISAVQPLALQISLNFPSSTDTAKQKYVLSDHDFKTVLASLTPEKLDAQLFSIDEHRVTVWDFLAQIAFDEPIFSSGKKEYVFQKLNTLAKKFVQNRILTREAIKLGLKNNSSLQSELQRWKESLLAQILKVSYLDSSRVSDDEVRTYFDSELAGDDELIYINLQLLTLSRLPEIEDVLRLLSSGTTFTQILSRYGKTDPLVNDSGGTGLVPAMALGNIGIIAMNMPLNQIYGPVKRDNGYSLFVVTEKSKQSDTLLIDYNNSKEQIRTYLRQKKLNTAVSGTTVKLAAKYGATVDRAVFDNIKTTDIYMFTHRLMGFGGRISAIPLLDNWADWIDLNEFNKVLLP